MRRFFLTAVPMMLILALFAGCGANAGRQKALDFRTKLLGCEQYTMTAEIAANYENLRFDFTLDCTAAPGGDMAITVTAPEEISGICATVQSDCQTVQFNELSLEFGTLADGQISPVCAPALLASCWQSEYIDSVGQDGEETLVVYRKGYGQQEVVARCWFDGETMTPTYAELWYGDTAVLSAEITNFSMQ